MQIILWRNIDYFILFSKERAFVGFKVFYLGLFFAIDSSEMIRYILTT